MDEQLVDYAEAAIRAFLAERPDSADTLEGIHRWWIRWPGLAESQVVTQVALERLENTAEVERFKIGNSIVWRRRRVPESVA